jgi:hypothetical protein
MTLLQFLQLGGPDPAIRAKAYRLLKSIRFGVEEPQGLGGYRNPSM